jgi:hypothetical protein
MWLWTMNIDKNLLQHYQHGWQTWLSLSGSSVCEHLGIWIYRGGVDGSNRLLARVSGISCIDFELRMTGWLWLMQRLQGGERLRICFKIILANVRRDWGNPWTAWTEDSRCYNRGLPEYNAEMRHSVHFLPLPHFSKACRNSTSKPKYMLKY